MKRYGIDVIPGLASVPAPGRVLVDGQEEIEAGNIIVATGALNKGLAPASPLTANISLPPAKPLR